MKGGQAVCDRGMTRPGPLVRNSRATFETRPLNILGGRRDHEGEHGSDHETTTLYG